MRHAAAVATPATAVSHQQREPSVIPLAHALRVPESLLSEEERERLARQNVDLQAEVERQRIALEQQQQQQAGGGAKQETKAEDLDWHGRGCNRPTGSGRDGGRLVLRRRRQQPMRPSWKADAIDASAAHDSRAHDSQSHATHGGH